MNKKILVSALALIMIVSLVGCGSKTKKVVVASKPMTEQYILAEMITALIEGNTDIKVEKKLGIGGGTSNIQPAMIKGEIDIYPEYTGTGWLFVLKKNLIRDPAKLYEEVKKEYKAKYNIKWLGLYGFNDTYALAIKKSVTDKLNINTYSDLASKSDSLKFGAEPDFYEREDGYKGLQKEYNFKFKEKRELDIGLKYEAINSDNVDVINAFSTDALLKKYDMKVIVDDKNFFPSYFASTLIREETLKKYPELENVLNKLQGKINDKEMIQMNYLVESEKKDPKDVAVEFLKGKGLLK
ncbi:glycine/betaine ABC transporter substrate-binding protein [Clostridium tagluense]|uniref:glycine betaine ABC transporter substrate-binding protein n=1 Tax=Clostridium tagluense TaxID=360422 RepID=UPI001CF28B0D|nr:glycine betaine ABC transporter substrate-binding protein [Clostridium tagluense]MCB2310282.1 glycine/betaine ABC transporter substrate-binding protein [Clostridium tagluense]MCB2315076.1 glycine/betaine ABC transporter substrate-binding protein [Clostridium tagluense]MCB2319982.1 glycine/betaine ABC transporter substrate-binding protein [Clostridium tagluense]MCB2324819.1 glycine/betaine ABC transporter substrate-binding protein [Clostridium tagluense]MCB2329727.1 glycine/betaine ABC trans